MRLTAVLTLLLAATFAGCTDDDTTDDVTPTPDDDSDDVAAYPEPMDESEMVLFGLDAFNLATGLPCSTPASTCTTYPFSLDRRTAVTASLTWGLPVNDLDLYLVAADGTVVSQDGINLVGDPPNTSQTMTGILLEPGDYSFYVSMWLVVAETYQLSATFEAPGA
jgi:hypothetical protein